MFSPERAIPIDEIRKNPNTAMVCTRYGGHISFCEGIMPTGCNYSCRLLTEYLTYVLNEEQANNTSSDSQKEQQHQPVFNLD